MEAILIMMFYIRPKHKAEFAVYLYACEQILPYLFTLSHWSYARDNTVYMRTMQRRSNNALEPFMNGQIVAYLGRSFWNGIWSYMSIKATYTKTDKGHASLNG